MPTREQTSASARTYGTPNAAITPREALLAEIARTTGAIEWLQQEIAQLEPEQLYRGTRSVKRVDNGDGGTRTTTEAGSTRHELLALFIEERRHLHALCRDALSLKQPDAPTGGWPRAT
jgi:hypothetical protein